MIKILPLVILFIFLTNIINAQSTSHQTKAKHGQPEYKYLQYLPENFDSLKKTTFPLIIYLHGKSACGDDLSKLQKYGLPFFMDRGMKIKAIVVAPQCPFGKNWTQDSWFEPFYQELIHKYHIDTTRVYLTGMSLGGFGTWDLAILYPYRFAAIVPLCGGGRPDRVCAIKNVPVWAIHGDKDEQVPIGRSAEMIKALEKCGGNAKFTILKDQPHDIHRTFGDEKIYDWMFEHVKGKNIEQHNKNVVIVDTAQITKTPERVRKSRTKVIQKPIVRNVESKHKIKQEVDLKKDKNTIQTDTIRGKNFHIVF